MKRFFSLRRLWMIFLLPIGLLTSLLFSHFPKAAQWYATHPYAAISKTINHCTSLVPFSVAEILLYFLIIFLIFYFIIGIIRIVRISHDRSFRIAKLILNPLCGLCLLYFLFVFFCGINYSRLTFAQTCSLPVQNSSQEQLYKVCCSLADDASVNRSKLKQNKIGIMRSDFPDLESMEKESAYAFSLLSSEYPTLPADYGPPKGVFASRLMSKCNITGIFIPFTFEANVNTDIPDFSIPATMCHELTHLRGYMREDEANFVAYLACLKSKNPEFNYSGNLLAFSYSIDALSAKNPNLAKKAYSHISPAVKRDLAFQNIYWQKFKGPVAKAANSVNNSYLKANRQNDGVESYGRMVDLILAKFRKSNKI